MKKDAEIPSMNVMIKTATIDKLNEMIKEYTKILEDKTLETN